MVWLNYFYFQLNTGIISFYLLTHDTLKYDKFCLTSSNCCTRSLWLYSRGGLVKQGVLYKQNNEHSKFTNLPGDCSAPWNNQNMNNEKWKTAFLIQMHYCFVKCFTTIFLQVTMNVTHVFEYGKLPTKRH